MTTLRLPEKEYALLCKAILQRDGWKCRSCGFRSGLHVHHITFRSQQGTDEASNLITLCSSCHRGVHQDVKGGEYGLTIVNDNGYVMFLRRKDWRPH
jgi:5-methylcytosine-specific restriction endonuclease McrA